MFAQLFATIRLSADRSAASLRLERDLAVLEQPIRTEGEEQQAQRIETNLFFDSTLLAAAQKRRGYGHSLSKTLLASIAGAVLFVSPYVANAEDATDEPATTPASTSEDGTTIEEQFKEWLEWMGLLDEGNTDPLEGED